MKTPVSLKIPLPGGTRILRMYSQADFMTANIFYHHDCIRGMLGVNYRTNCTGGDYE